MTSPETWCSSTSSESPSLRSGCRKMHFIYRGAFGAQVCSLKLCSFTIVAFRGTIIAGANKWHLFIHSRKLDLTTAELKRTAGALEREKAKTDMLLYQMLPVKVANSLRDGHKVEAGTKLVTYLWPQAAQISSLVICHARLWYTQSNKIWLSRFIL